MATATTSHRPIVLESLGLLDDDDADMDVPQPSRPAPLREQEINMTARGDVFNALNTLAAGKSSTKPTHATYEADDMDLEALLEQEREQMMEQHQHDEGPPSDYEDDDDDEMEALRELEGQPEIQAQPSSDKQRAPIQLQDNGLLDSDDDDDETHSRTVIPSHHQSTQSSSSSGQATPQPSNSTSAPRSIPMPSLSSRPTVTASTSTSAAASSSSSSHYAAIPKYIPAGHFAAVNLDGEPIRFEMRRRIKGWKPPPPHYGQSRSTGLLSRPIHRIIDSIKATEAEEIVQRDERAAAQASTRSTPPRHTDPRPWAEKYRPKRFTELLGDERLHRDVMSWLKDWDPCVFKRKPKKRARDADAATQPQPGPSRFGARPVDFKDPYDRPQQRVLLLSGPPGLGKTTLAHVLATAAGYGVYELNASDARSSGSVTGTIKMALESASLKDPRPTCLVVDEIDGATGGAGGSEESRGFIKALVDLIEDGKGSASGSRSRKKKKGTKPLLRPIICICNDLYAPALRPLRQYCRMVRFQRPTSNHLVTRLRGICEREQLSASSRALSLLVELSQGDIRSCLNALQLAQLKQLRGSGGGAIEITEQDIRALGSGGIKDGSTNLQCVWSALFKTPSPKERARKTAPFEGPALTQHLVSLVQSSGDHNRVLQGCFEHYPNLNFIDDGWWRIKNILTWIDWGSEMQDKAFSNGLFDLMGYVPWGFVKWNLLFANTVNTLPEWPRVDYENYLKRQAFDEVTMDLQGKLPPLMRSQFNRHSIITELGPSLIQMFRHPDLKPAAAAVATTKSATPSSSAQRQTLSRLIEIMLSMDIAFVQDKTETGHVIWTCDPPLDTFVTFTTTAVGGIGEAASSSAAVKATSSSNAIRSMIMKELEVERTRRKREEILALNSDGKGTSASSTAASALEAYKTGANGASVAVGVKPKKAALDFFGRPVVEKEKRKSTVAGTGGSGAPLPAPILAARMAKAKESGSVEPHPHTKRIKVHYRYNEGYSNAVRQPIKMSALL